MRRIKRHYSQYSSLHKKYRLTFARRYFFYLLQISIIKKLEEQITVVTYLCLCIQL